MAGRRLVLIRHSKAEAHGGNDHERALAARGLRDATAIGQWLVERQLLPDHAAVSSALRTRQTWSQIAAELPTPPEATLEPRIYDNSVADLLAVIALAPEAAQTVVIVGHNPSLQQLAGVADFPTSAVAAFEVGTRWSDVTDDLGAPIASGAPRG